MSEISKMWQIFSVDTDSILELRALWPKGIKGYQHPITKHFHCSDYSDIATCQRVFERDALELNAEGFNIYIVMNPIREDFEGKSASDKDIQCRRLLLIDIDRIGETDCPATDDEVHAAKELGGKIRTFMYEEGCPTPFEVMSGNGWHLYYALTDVENNDENTTPISKLLHLLSEKFNTVSVGVDTSVFNASRITKVPGTIARKGKESVGRPYRMAVVHGN